MSAEDEIRRMVDLETRAWNTKDVELLISLLHPDMVWPFPRDAQAHDPLHWQVGFGRYDRERWRAAWQGLFDSHELVHNEHVVRKILVSDEQDGGFAVVDVDTRWRDRQGREERWCGRACKVYTKRADGWKMIFQSGLLDYDGRSS